MPSSFTRHQTSGHQTSDRSILGLTPWPRASKPLRFRWKRFFRYLYLRFLRLKGSPRAIARGLAVGAFAGMFPLFGLQMLLGILLAVVFKGNKLAAAAATWLSNPLTYVPIYAMNYHIGRVLLRLDEVDVARQSFTDWNQIIAFGSDVLASLMVGSCVVGLIVSLMAYCLGYQLSCQFRKRQLHRLKQKIRRQLYSR